MENTKHTIEEIENFIDVYFGNLNLSTKEKERYKKFIQSNDNYTRRKMDSFEYIENNLQDLINFFENHGYNNEESKKLASKTVLYCNRKKLVSTLNFLIASNLIEDAIIKNEMLFFSDVSHMHAKKMYLINHEYNDKENVRTIIKMPIKKFMKKYNIKYDILIKYPITKELEQIWSYQSKKSNEEIKKEFNLTREEISDIYPTNIDELSTIKAIGNMKEEEIINKYGVTKQELLQKHPLNNDTLKALKSINQSNDKAIQNTFNKTKQEVLQLRTITTEMIIIAQKERLTLKRNNQIREKQLTKH